MTDPNPAAEGEFLCAHYKSRAEVAERELEDARRVLASLRHYFHKLERTQPVTVELEPVRENLRKHDQKHWTQEHAMNAVAEFFAGVDE